ncbi:MAG: ABC transporter ATP-binding protein [Spirochaetia bacterium]
MSDEIVPILEIQGLKQYFCKTKGLFKKETQCVRAVDGVDLQVYEGETLGVVGESGCGKSTLLRSIAQLRKPTAGTVVFEGEDLTQLSNAALLKVRKDMQMIFQDPYASLNPRMNVRQIIAEPLEIYRKRGLINIADVEIGARVKQLMQQVGLLESHINRFPHEFSGGQRQRIGIARALALNPRLILADEPVSALDVSIQSQILNLLKDLQKELNLTYVFIAHDLAVVRYVSDRIAVMYLGRVVEIAEAKAIYEKPVHPYTQALMSAIPIPDPAKERRATRVMLKGEILQNDTPLVGCAFAPRCPYAQDRCLAETPTLKNVGENHQSACFLRE